MARIRTIKPEFPQSESMGRVSRDARLLFIQLWPICDDHGRTRAASRMLASLLFPYDEDAKSLIDGWLSELADEGCIVLYEVDGARYLKICNWLKHQKIDKPSKPLFPEFVEDSRILASPREPSPLDQGPGKGEERKGEKTPSQLSLTGDEPSPPKSKSTSVNIWSIWETMAPGKRSILGKLIKEYGDEAVASKIGAMSMRPVADPVSYLTGALRRASNNMAPTLSGSLDDE